MSETTAAKEITKRRAEEKAKAKEECAKSGHLFYSARRFCARCFAPKAEGWQR